MTYLYHRVPQSMKGTVLYPLNILKEIDSEAYEREVAKYADRMHVMEKNIPGLACKWNDVIHLSPIHPEKIVGALTEAGFTPPSMQFYQIAPTLLERENTTVYLNTGEEDESQNFALFDPADVARYDSVPSKTKEYYKAKKSEGSVPLTYVSAPHVLYKGSIDVTNLPIITTVSKKWSVYNTVHASREPRAQLVRAVSFCDKKNAALDLGAGTLIESKHLLDVGFSSVTAVDSSVLSNEFAETLPKENFKLIISRFQDFTFVPHTYDLINAQYALPFYGKKDFDSFIEKITASLKPGGILVGQFFGIRDGWNTGEGEHVFHTKEEVLDLLKGLEIVECVEEEKDGKTASGNKKQWHVFHVIAKKALGGV